MMSFTLRRRVLPRPSAACQRKTWEAQARAWRAGRLRWTPRACRRWWGGGEHLRGARASCAMMGSWWRASTELARHGGGVVALPSQNHPQVLLESGYNIATLLAMYGSNTDWRDPTTWSCNNNVHASRHGGDGTAACVRIPAYTQVPTMASTCIHSRRCLSRRAGLWYVCQLFSETTSSGVTTQGEPFVARYSRWFMKRALGRSTAEGTKDLKKYRWVVFVCVLSCIALAPQWPRRYFISNAAIQRQDMSACYPFLRG